MSDGWGKDWEYVIEHFPDADVVTWALKYPHLVPLLRDYIDDGYVLLSWLLCFGDAELLLDRLLPNTKFLFEHVYESWLSVYPSDERVLRRRAPQYAAKKKKQRKTT